MKKLLFVVGTRPEIIKTAPVVIEARRRRKFKARVCFTGQHQAMVDQMLRDFRLPVDFDLKVMRRKQSLGGLSARTLEGLEKVWPEFEPDFVFVQGDTTTAAMAAQSAFYNRIPVGHIEAGLRTGDRFLPFPEEANRMLISAVADLHFSPTGKARANLLAEGKDPATITETGNTVIDALKYVLGLKRGYINQRLKGLDEMRGIVLVTMHRRESFGEPLKNICRALAEMASRHPEVLLIYPVHLNPSVLLPVRKFLGGIDNIWLLEPLHYRDLVRLMSESLFVLTDSGGIQEEAPSCNKPVLVLREKTERPEGVALGVSRLVGSDPDVIVPAAEELLANRSAYRRMQLGRRKNPYGDGLASRRIMDRVEQFLAEKESTEKVKT